MNRLATIDAGNPDRWATRAAVLIVLLATGIGLARAVAGSAGDIAVIASIGCLLVLVAWAGSRVAGGRRAWIPVLALGALALPLSLAGASTIAYPGLGGLSSADIQFLRAAEYALANGPLGAQDARLMLYPTSFAGLAGVARLTGLDLVDVIRWSWVVSLPIMIGGFGLFVREWTGSRLAGALGMLICISNPWFFVVPIYDGFNLTLLPVWSYILLRALKRVGVGAVLCSLLLIAVIVTSHFFTSLFSIAIGLAIAGGLWIVRGAGARGFGESGQSLGGVVGNAALVPLIGISAWLVYVSERYLRESVGLLVALLAALDDVSRGSGFTGLSLVSPIQVAILMTALGVYAIAALTLSAVAIRTRSRRWLATMAVATIAVPLVIWALITPPQFSLGTDLKEWKVRPLFGAFVLVAPLLAIGLMRLARALPRGIGPAAVTLGLAAILLNAQTLSLGYGSIGTRTYVTAGPPTTVEDGTLAADQYRALGQYVRAEVPRPALLIADWRQSNWMVGVGGLQTIPLFLIPALSDASLLDDLLAREDLAGVAVDRNLLTLQSIYHDRLADPGVIASLQDRPLDRVFDAGDQILYLTHQ